jgi:hypothetical protein
MEILEYLMCNYTLVTLETEVVFISRNWVRPKMANRNEMSLRF